MNGIANWALALPMLVMAVILLLWGADLVITEMMVKPPWWKPPLTSGAFHLGSFFITIAVALFGILGILLLSDPNDMAPAWFAVPMIVAALQCILAWWFMTFTVREDDE